MQPARYDDMDVDEAVDLTERVKRLDREREERMMRALGEAVTFQTKFIGDVMVTLVRALAARG